MTSDSTMQRLRAARPPVGKPRKHSELFSRIVAEPGDARVTGEAGRSRRFGAVRLRTLRRPRILAGGSLGLAALAAGLVLALGGTTATAPAFAVTREADGSVLVTLSNPKDIVSADEQLILAIKIARQVNYTVAAGPARSSAPVACRAVLGPGDDRPDPHPGAPVKMLLGSDNTATGTPNNSGVPSGLLHLVSCVDYPAGPGSELGNSGAAFLKAHGGH